MITKGSRVRFKGNPRYTGTVRFVRQLRDTDPIQVEVDWDSQRWELRRWYYDTDLVDFMGGLPVPVPKPIKKRGRPPKVRQATLPNVKRPKGRPKKVVAPETKPEPTGVKRKRGRPRKNV